MKTLCSRAAVALLILMAPGIVLPGLSAAQAPGNPPANALAEAVVGRLAGWPEYVHIDSVYETNKAGRGEEWTGRPEAQAMLRVREEILAAARSAAIETDQDGRRVVVFTQKGEKHRLGGLVPSLAENDADTRYRYSLIIIRFINEIASADKNYQSVMAAIDAAENPPLPDIDRGASPVVLGAFVEAPAPYPLGLPAPGPSSKADLLPQAEAARQRGLKAAGSGDWPGAVAAFKEANKLSYCSPSLMFNLALAYQRGGWPVQAAMYYRAYLAARPDAPNAAEVRAELPKLVAEIETRSLREFDEAERLAETLSDTPPTAGTKSLRQSALESMSRFAYLAGLTDRGDALVRKASALPGAPESTEKGEFPDKHGLYAAAYSWDARRLEEIAAGFGNEYTPERIFNHRTYARALRGDWGEVRKIVDADPAGLLSENELGSKKFWMRQAGAYEMLEILHGLNLDKANDLYVGTMLSDLHEIFWNGRPDIAQRLARRALEHYRKFNPGGSRYPRWDYVSYLIPNAVLGDGKAIVQEMERWKSNRLDVSLDDSIIEVAAMYVAASMTPADAEATIKVLIRQRYIDLNAATEANIPETSWPNGFPQAYFALAAVQGDSKGALKYLERGEDPSGEEYQLRMWRALRFAVATGRAQLAFALSEKMPRDWNTLYQLNRLAANPAAGASVREQVSRYALPLSGGWRPADAEQARKVWLHLKHANNLNDEKEYGILPEDAEKTAREKPEQLPAEMAAHALVLWMGAMAARLDE